MRGRSIFSKSVPQAALEGSNCSREPLQHSSGQRLRDGISKAGSLWLYGYVLQIDSGDADIHPHQPVVGAGEREDADQPEQGIIFQWPEDRCIYNLQILPREHIVRSEVAGRAVCEVRRVERRITPVREVGTALQIRLLRSALTRWRYLSINQWVLQQLLDRARDAVAVERV